jgi:hypothetical protein
VSLAGAKRYGVPWVHLLKMEAECTEAGPGHVSNNKKTKVVCTKRGEDERLQKVQKVFEKFSRSVPEVFQKVQKVLNRIE